MLAKTVPVLLAVAAFAAAPFASAEAVPADPCSGLGGLGGQVSPCSDARCVGLPCDLVNAACHLLYGRYCVR